MWNPAVDLNLQGTSCTSPPGDLSCLVATRPCLPPLPPARFGCPTAESPAAAQPGSTKGSVTVCRMSQRKEIQVQPAPGPGPLIRSAHTTPLGSHGLLVSARSWNQGVPFSDSRQYSPITWDRRVNYIILPQGFSASALFSPRAGRAFVPGAGLFPAGL